MEEEKIKNAGKVLYMTGYSDDSNETVVYALDMPVSVAVHIEMDGSVLIQFRERQEHGHWRTVCQTGVVPDIAPPADFANLKNELDLDENIAKTVAGWVTIFMREGTFCTDSSKMTFVSFFDLRDIADRLQKNLEEVYEKYKKSGC